MISREYKDKLWAQRWKKFPRNNVKANPVQAKLNELTKAVMKEVLEVNPKHAIAAIMDLASYMKTIGMGTGAFQAIMQNLELMSEQAGRPPGEIRRYLRNKEYYLGKSKIMVI